MNIAQIKSSLRKINRKQSNVSYYRATDLFVIDFPKSGVTWLSTLLANLILIKNRSDMKATFFNISSQLILDTDIEGVAKCEASWKWPPYRILKSHSAYNPLFLHVIYLVRHPYRVMDSYYRFYQDYGRTLPSFETFVLDNEYGIYAWKRHIKSWLNNTSQQQRFHLIRYEDLRKETFFELCELIENLGWEFSKQEIDNAIELSLIKNMKASESLYRKRNPRYTMNMINSGKTETHDHSSIVKMIEDVCHDELKMLGYI